MTRINLRLGQDLKDRIEAAAGKPVSPSTRGWFARLQRLWKAARTEALRDSARPKVPKASAAGCTDTGFIFRTTLFHQRDNLIGSITMPTFSTPDPITLNFDVAVGHIRITASSRNDTVVEVLPSNSSREVDVRVAEQTRVEFAGGRLQIKTPKQRGSSGIFGKTGSVDISVQLPSGSELEGTAAVASLRSEGTLGRTRGEGFRGRLHTGNHRALNVSTGAGAIIVEHVAGDIDMSTGSGSIRIGRVDGNAEVKNSNGDINIGTITGALKAKTANGSVAVEHAESDASAATANGDIRFETIESGVVSAKTAAGRIHIGVRSGTAARFDAHTSFGRVDNQMNATHGPASTERRVDVRAHTSYGDIVIRRSSPEKNPTEDLAKGTLMSRKPAITATGPEEGLTTTRRYWTESTSPSTAEPSLRSSAPTAPARPPSWKFSRPSFGRRRQQSASPGTTLPTIPTRCVRASASPGSSQRSTTICPVRKTFSSWPTCTISARTNVELALKNS